ncbi:hypothetical protein ABN028_19430 [Actinopolymorpha sp. B17G11]|uniref:hypothetical protein n=1 Tax=Actinopolymorpha sp. B17G11 TaxID=3160861 RepID=UPI0032E3754F
MTETELRTEFKVRLSSEERAELRRLAGMHGVPMAVYLRSQITQSRTAAGVSDDDWWHSHTPPRKSSIRRWLDEARKQQEGPIPGQLVMTPTEDHAEAV